jgi:hypothetical protein
MLCVIVAPNYHAALFIALITALFIALITVMYNHDCPLIHIIDADECPTPTGGGQPCSALQFKCCIKL